MFKADSNRWKAFAVGLAGGLAGIWAMNKYFSILTDVLGDDPREWTKEGGEKLPEMAPVEQRYREGENSTVTTGRMVHRTLMGKEPETEETKELLSYSVHYGYGAVQGGVVNALRAGAGWPDLAGGTAYGTFMWLYSIVGLPLMGMSKGPTAYTKGSHAATWGAHLVYGVTARAVGGLLQRIL